ncbi:hypothetical protein EBZ37_05380, partial [bacterium]|nr:hypothetical protein [bacterium]
NSIPGSRYLSARAAGMADAFLPLPEDGASALFYNPAAIASLKKLGGEVVNVTFESNNDYLLGFAPLDFYKVPSLPSYAPTLSAGEYPGVGLSIFPNFYARGFAFGALLQSRVSAKNEGGQVSYRSSYQFIPSIGTGIRLANGLFRLGYSLQFVSKAEGEVTNVPISSSPLGYNQQLNQGSAVSHNLGATITLPIQWLPTVSAVGRNIGSAIYKSQSLIPFARNATGVPATEPLTVDLALGLHPRIGSGDSLNMVFQLKDATNQSGFQLMDRFTFGTEVAFRGALSLRLGYGLGSGLDGINAGIGYKGQKGDFGFAWYREELGTPSASDRERRWLMQYQMRVF